MDNASAWWINGVRVQTDYAPYQGKPESGCAKPLFVERYVRSGPLDVAGWIEDRERAPAVKLSANNR